MRHRVGLIATQLFAAAGLQGQQPAPRPTPIPEPPIVIYQVDLVPTGTVFAMNKPTLEGDVWVFNSLPDRTMSRIPASKVKQITRRSDDLNKEVVWQIDLVPTGNVLSREEPVKKGMEYILRTFKEGELISLRQADVRKVTRLTGLNAFRAKQLKLGLVVLTSDPPP